MERERERMGWEGVEEERCKKKRGGKEGRGSPLLGSFRRLCKHVELFAK